jgi:hypothetical protein
MGRAVEPDAVSRRACFSSGHQQSFIKFDLAQELRQFFILHCGANARAHIPSRLIGACSDHPVDLVSAHALLGVEHEEDNAEPLPQRIVGVLEYGAGNDAKAIAVLLVASYDPASLRHRGLFAALAEIVERTRRELVRLFATTGAFDLPIWPTLGFQKCLTGCFIGEPLEQFTERHLLRRIHDEDSSPNLDRCQVPDNPL